MAAGANCLTASPYVLSSCLEEAVNEVKRQAMSELQKAVSDAERKAHDMISAERSKMERALAEAKRQASEDALTVINQQEDSSEVSTARMQQETFQIVGFANITRNVFSLVELLELRSQGQRDVQRLQHSTLLRLLLPAQGLGEAPSRMRPRPAGSPRQQQRPARDAVHHLVQRSPHSLREHPAGTPLSDRANQQQSQGGELQQRFPLDHAGNARPDGLFLPLTDPAQPRLLLLWHPSS